jgi:hypothetical protein
MLSISFMPQLAATGLSISTQRFMQDGAMPHASNIMSGFCHDTFDPRVICGQYADCHAYGRIWSPNSLDITCCNFFLWGFMKEKLFLKNTA